MWHIVFGLGCCIPDINDSVKSKKSFWIFWVCRTQLQRLNSAHTHKDLELQFGKNHSSFAFLDT